MNLKQQVVVFASWVALFYGAAIMSYTQYISLYYLPAGVSTAAFFVFGKRIFPAVFCAIFFVSLDLNGLLQGRFDPHQLATATLFAMVHTGAYAFAGLSAQFISKHVFTNSLPAKNSMILICYTLAALIAATGALLIWELVTLRSDIPFIEAWLPFWIGDAVGVVVITPLFAVLFRRLLPKQRIAWLDVYFEHDHLLNNQWGPYIFKLAALLITVITVLLLDNAIAHPSIGMLIFFVAIPQLWIAFTEQTIRTIFSLILLTVVISSGYNFLALGNNAVIYQIAIYFVAVTCYLGTAVPALHQRNQDLEQDGIYNKQTGLYSANYFEQAANLLIANRKPTQELSIAVIDIDQLQQINTECGFSTGDTVISQVATALQQHLPHHCLVAHSHGDIYWVLLPSTSVSNAVEILDKIRRNMPFVKDEHVTLRIKLNIGVTSLHLSETTSTALNRAFIALEQAKASGRDKVCVN
ncbi:MAG: diguanylate cyclase [Pseudidiomarina maritima]|nr:diguanylate cyclase [Pseudidiomarina maritima]